MDVGVWGPPASRPRDEEDSVTLIRQLAPEYIQGEDYRVGYPPLLRVPVFGFYPHFASIKSNQFE